MTALALRFLWVSLTTSLVLLPLLLGSGAILGRYRAKSCYLLWLLLALRLLIPVEVPIPQAPVTVEVPAAVLPAPVGENAPGVALPQGQGMPQLTFAEPGFSLADGLAAVWALGAVVVLCFQCECCFTARKALLKTARACPEDQLLLAQLGGAVPVLRADVDTPMTLGLLRPVVLLPRAFSEEDLPLVLRHELCHIKRGDLWYKALFLLCAALHWFNPLVWKLARVAGETVELCCDGDVVAGQDAGFRKRYGQVLLHSAAAQPEVVLSTPFGSGDLKGRLMNLFVTKKKGAALVCAAACAALMMGSLVGCEAEASPTPDQSVSPSTSQGIPTIADLPEEGEGMSVGTSSSTPPGEEGTSEAAWVWPVEDHYTLSALYQKGRVHPVTGEHNNHDGIDITANSGIGVLAAADGVALVAEYSKLYGNYVVLDHGNGISTHYCHMSKLLVEEGSTVEAGQFVGAVGQTGAATGPHLHFELREDGEAIDPLSCYPGMSFEMTDGPVSVLLPD